MKVIVCTGSPGSGLKAVSNMLSTAGVTEALPAEKSGLTLTAWHDQLLTKIGNGSSGQLNQIMPNGDWERHAIAILKTNDQQEIWGWTDPKSTWLLDFWKELATDIHFVLTYARPEYEYAERLHSGAIDLESVDDIMDNWLRYNQQLLRFYNRNRGRSILVNSAACISDSEKFFQLCNDNFGLARDKGNNSEQLDLPKLSPIARVLSSNEISARSELKKLHLEINATANLPTIVDENINSDTARDEYLSLLNSKEDLTARLLEITQSLQLAKERVNKSHQLQNKLGHSVKINKKLKTTNASLQQKLKFNLDAVNNTEEKLKTISSEKTELKTENELLLLQLHQVQEELERYFLLYQKSEARGGSQPIQSKDGRYIVFMSEIIEGVNWYPSENDKDGTYRWTGPGVKTNIRMPVKHTKESLLIIEYRNTMTPDQLSKLRIEINGKIVSYKIHKEINPKYIEAQLSGSDSDVQEEKIEVSLILPHTVSPNSVNEKSLDKRNLGLCVNSISVIPSQPALFLLASGSLITRLKQGLNRLLHKVPVNGFPLNYFDGLAYLEANPKVKEEVQEGLISSALKHYLTQGINKQNKLPISTSDLPNEGNLNDLTRALLSKP
jgi:hypothetical protein